MWNLFFFPLRFMLSEWLTHTIFKHNAACALFQDFSFLPFSPLAFFLSCRLPQAQPHVPALLPLAITSVNTVVMQTANVKPPITQSVAFYLPPRSSSRSLLHASASRRLLFLFSLSLSLFFLSQACESFLPCQQVRWLSIPFSCKSAQKYPVMNFMCPCRSWRYLFK